MVFAAPPFLDVRRQRVRTTSGRVVDDYYQVTFPDFAICCAVTTDQRIVTLWQYKHGARASGLTFPAGIIEPGEPAEDAMRRELLEETGYAAGAAHFLGRYVCNSNQGAGWAHLFVLEDCSPDVAQQFVPVDVGKEVVDITGSGLGQTLPQTFGHALDGGPRAPAGPVGVGMFQELVFEKRREQPVEGGQDDAVLGADQGDWPTLLGVVGFADGNQGGRFGDEAAVAEGTGEALEFSTALAVEGAEFLRDAVLGIVRQDAGPGVLEFLCIGKPVEQVRLALNHVEIVEELAVTRRGCQSRPVNSPKY